MNLFHFRKRGNYKIVCTKNKKIYYVQTSCFLRRCFQHLQSLKKKRHPCDALQNNVNLYDKVMFDFEIVEIEDNKGKRLKFEKTALKTNHLIYYTIEETPYFFFKQSRVLLNA